MDKAIFKEKYPTLDAKIALRGFIKKREILLLKSAKEKRYLKKAVDFDIIRLTRQKLFDIAKEQKEIVKGVDKECLSVIQHVNNRVQKRPEFVKKFNFTSKTGTLLKRYSVGVYE